MALLAHRLAQRRLQDGRVDDGVVEVVHGVRHGILDVALARAVAALAADAFALDQRLLVAVDAPRDGRVRLAWQNRQSAGTGRPARYSGENCGDRPQPPTLPSPRGGRVGWGRTS